MQAMRLNRPDSSMLPKIAKYIEMCYNLLRGRRSPAAPVEVTIMKKHHGFRDFLYNNNDILLAVVVTVCAALIIIWRLQIITDYPKSVAESAKAIAEAQQTEQPEISPGAETEVPEDTAGTAASVTATFDDEGKLEYDMTVTLPTSSQEAALEMLFNSQLIVNEEEWKTIIEDEGLPSDKIIAKQYTFPAGTTKVDIIRTVTGTDGTGE